MRLSLAGRVGDRAERRGAHRPRRCARSSRSRRPRARSSLRRRRRDVRVPVPRPVGRPGDLADLAQLRLAGSIRRHAASSSLLQAPPQPAVGQALLRGSAAKRGTRRISGGMSVQTRRAQIPRSPGLQGAEGDVQRPGHAQTRSRSGGLREPVYTTAQGHNRLSIRRPREPVRFQPLAGTPSQPAPTRLAGPRGGRTYAAAGGNSSISVTGPSFTSSHGLHLRAEDAALRTEALAEALVERRRDLRGAAAVNPAGFRGVRPP